MIEELIVREILPGITELNYSYLRGEVEGGACKFKVSLASKRSSMPAQAT